MARVNKGDVERGAFRGLVTVPLLAVMLAFPASAQTGSDSETLSTGTAGAQAQSESTGGPTSSNPATPKYGSDAASRIRRLRKPSLQICLRLTPPASR